MADLGLWTGLNQAVGNTAATGMKLMEFKAQREHQQALEVTSAAHLKLAQDQAKIQNASATIDLEKKKKEAEFLQSGWEPSIDPAITGMRKEDQEKFLGMIDKMKVPKTQEGRIQAKNILFSNQEIFKQFTTSLFQKKLEDYFDVQAEYNAALEKGDPEKIAAIKQKYDAVTQTVHKTRGEIDKGIKVVAMNELWNKLPEEIKSIPVLGAAYQIGARTGDTTQFDKAMLELTKEGSAAAIRTATEAATNKRAADANATRIKAAEIGAAGADKRSEASNATRIEATKITAGSKETAATKEKAKVEALKDKMNVLIDQAYQTAEDVKKAFKKGTITQDQAAGILRRKFGMQ